MNTQLSSSETKYLTRRSSLTYIHRFTNTKATSQNQLLCSDQDMTDFMGDKEDENQLARNNGSSRSRGNEYLVRVLVAAQIERF